MEKKLKEKLLFIIQKAKLDKKTLFIIFIGILGMLLIAFSELSDNTEKEIHQQNESINYDEERLQNELEELISKVSGAGRVKVMITYESSGESIYAQNSSQQQDENSSKTSNEYIIIDNGNEEGGLLEKKVLPKVLGVAVVCDGGKDPIVKNEITMMLKAVFNISSNNISILEMQN